MALQAKPFVRPTKRPQFWTGPLLVLPLAGLLLFVIWSVYRHFDPTQGFDYGGHLDYVRYVDFTASLPLANRGWQMYHPPAYYVLTAGLFEGLHRLGVVTSFTDSGRALATAAWVLQGVIAAAAVRAFGGRWIGAAVASGLSWLIPGQAMMGTMLYNETLTGLGVALLVLGLPLWLRGSRSGLFVIGFGFALAVLSKYSGLLAGAVALPLVVWLARDRIGPTLAAFAPGLLLAAAFYGRNLLRFGTPLPSNIDFFHVKGWDPVGWGHPPHFFTTLSQGSCAASHSFWSGLWKWFWATDCLQLPWRSLLQGKLLFGAILTTILVIAALGWIGLRSFREPRLMLLAAVPAALLLGFIAYNLRWPALTSVKGVYILAALAPAAVATGLFVDRIAPGKLGVPVYAALLGWSALMVHAAALS